MLGGQATALALLVGGVIFLYTGAELLVAGAGRLALSLGLRAATIGVTVIAFVTTAPELFVATVGALDVSGDVGLGAVVGSNLANIGLVLGVAALIRPLEVTERVLRRHVPFMVGSALLLVVLSVDGRLGPLEGLVFLGFLGTFTVYLVYVVNRDPAPDVDHPGAGMGLDWRAVGFVLVGMVCLVVGSRWLVTGGVSVMAALGVSDLVIGLTILALGTSVPELATSVVGAMRDETAFSVGNVVGSNIYNVVAVLGVVTLIVPISVEPATLRFELPAMVVFTLVLVAMMAHGRRLSRLDGAVLVGGYAVFVALLFV